MTTYTKPQTKAQIKATVSTWSYYASHRKQPRGTGFWMFKLQTSVETTEHTFQGSYGEALSKMVDFAQTKATCSVQIITIAVMS